MAMALDRLLNLAIERGNSIFQDWRSAGKPRPFGADIALCPSQAPNARKPVCDVLMIGAITLTAKCP